MKKRLLALILVISVFCVSGCSANFVNGGNMMRPPRPTGDKADIQNIIETKAGAGFTFNYPQTGEYRSAITMEDLDNDGYDEAIALYSSGNENSKLNLMFMTKDSGEWKSIGNFTNGASGVDRMLFADINGDSQKELLLGWTSLGSNEKKLTIYAYEDDFVREMTVDSTYTELAAADFDNDAKDEIILLTIANNDEDSFAKFFKYSTKEKRPMINSSVQLDSNLTRIINVTVGMADSTTRAVFLDGETHAGTNTTQIIFWDTKNECLVNPLNVFDDSSNKTNISARTSSTICKDINNDGIIEIPSIATMPSGNRENAATICIMTTWNTYLKDTNTFTGVLNMVISYKEGYYIILPDKWMTKQEEKWPTYVTARINSDNRTMTFYEWITDNDSSGSIGEMLFTVCVYSNKEWKSENAKNMVMIRKTDSAVYAAKIENTKNDLSLNEDEIKDCFRIIS